MCGIYCTFCKVNNSSVEKVIIPKNLILNRGPDGYSEVLTEICSGWTGCLAGSTLWTQGPSVRLQPLVAANGSLFLWNGDKYPDLVECDGEHRQLNDSEEVFNEILSHGISYFTNVNGPYSFIYYDRERKELYFGRDVLGRHSLLWSITQDVIYLSSLGSSSCLPDIKLTEVPSFGLFKLDLSSSEIKLEVYPWAHLPIPQEIVVQVPIIISDKQFQHKVLLAPFGSSWINNDPQLPEAIEINEPKKEASSVFEQALKNALFAKIVNDIKDLLFNSVRKRISTKPLYCQKCLPTRENCNHSKIGVLFSGGLDSAILALVSNAFVDKNESIDLYNVAFQRSSKHNYDNVPDRINGKKTLDELKSLCPNRNWNFIEINVPTEELNEKRIEHISKLISPLSSVLDDSLGCALWFAARGDGFVDGNRYHSPSRVVLLGMGADELFGGYTKQRRIFISEGWRGLGKELCSSITNIGSRNLGRDNRVVADHGRQPRIPYLDENLVAYVDSLPPWNRCYLYPTFPIGIGDKFILRLLAWKLGLRGAASLPKKALQFGSQIANPKEKGHLPSERLTT